jgi:exosortase
MAILVSSPIRHRTSTHSRYFGFFLKAGVLFGLACGLYANVLAKLALDWWTEPRHTYGLLIPPLAVYLAWLRREITLSHPVAPDNRGLCLVALSSALYVLGTLGAEFFLARISFVVLLAGLTWTFWGVARFRSLSLPFLLLATMVPLPAIAYNTIAAPLQLFASEIAADLAQACGVSVYRDGNILTLAHVSLGVEEACSGLNSLSALIVAGVLLCFMLLSRPLVRWLLFAITIPLAIGVNILRVTITAILADYNEEFAMGFYHSFSGWLVFVVAFVSQYGIALLLGRFVEHVKDA